MHPEPSTRHSSPAPCQAQFDLVIVGGGLIGGSLACALADTGLRVAVIEAVAADAAVQPSYDERVIALSLGSRRILGAMGLWDGIAPEAEPILRVHVAERGGCGTTRLDFAELGVEALGYVASARAMGAAIRAALAAAPQVEWLCPARVTSQRLHADRVDLEVQCNGETRRLRTRLLVAADGGDSLIRRDQGIAVEERPYEQQAVITTVTPDRPRTGWAFERFTDTGPLALLPMTGGRYAVVWTCRETETAALLGLSDADFLARLQGRFGFRLGRLSQAAPRRAYPLKLLLTRETVRPRLVLIGNAAHTLHPVAGQGFNLGLRDVAALAEALAPIGEPIGERGFDPGAATVLAAYRAWRGRDQQRTATLTDTLARLFVNPWLPLRLGRNLGLLGLDLLPPARRAVARRFMGIGGRAPRLARGLPLGRNPAVNTRS
jgi:2-octaprenyl-6-methoxyphenol hydroxylase